MQIHFMLTQDAQSGATIREKFASINAVNVKVGTFDILLDLLMEYYLIISPAEDEWLQKLSQKALGMKAAFWSKSIKSDEKSVINELETTLGLLLNALPLGEPILKKLKADESRYKRYYNDLVTLHNEMGLVLPLTLSKAYSWSKNFHLKPIGDIVVYADGFLYLELWQRQIVEKLNKSLNEGYYKIYSEAFISKLNTTNKDIFHIQTTLFSDKLPQNPPPIKNIQWLVARDALQEVEVVAGMIQNLHKSGVKFDEIAIVIPKNGLHKDFLIQTFSTFNIPLSRAGQIEEYSDIGTQLVFDALQAQEKFAPSMIFSSLLASPLMPFSYDMGQYLAQIAQNGKLSEVNTDKLSDSEKEVLKLILIWSAAEREEDLTIFVNELQELYKNLSGAENMRLHKQRFKTAILELKFYIKEYSEVKALELLKQIKPQSIKESSAREAWLDSINVVYESDVMLQEQKHIFFLGFNEGHYPQKLEHIGVFSRTAWQALSHELNLDLELHQKRYSIAKMKLIKQLQCASQTITFLSSALDLQGTRTPISESLSDMAFCFNTEKDLDPEKLLIYLEEEKSKPFFCATNDDITIRERRKLEIEDLHFDKNIFELRKEYDGTLRPESPSSLEKLMISPLGWFLYRQGLESKVWAVEDLDVATQGTIAHGVFEDCFCPKNPNSDLSNIEQVIENRIQKHAPFLTKPHRRLEYEQLRSDILKSSSAFKTLLLHCDAIVTHTEDQLKGEIFNVPVAGRTDAILKFLGKNLVLDYKKSGHKTRVKRMKEGYDHQLFLYRVMLDDDEALTAYYTMNDSTLIVDREIECGNSELNILGVKEDCTVNAENILEIRIAELINGDIKLNIEGDEKLWADRGVTASYTLGGSPLISIFTKIEGQA